MSRLDFLKSKINISSNPVIDEAYKLHGKEVIDGLLLKCQSARVIAKAHELTAQNIAMILERIAEMPKESLVYTNKNAPISGF